MKNNRIHGWCIALAVAGAMILVSVGVQQGFAQTSDDTLPPFGDTLWTRDGQSMSGELLGFDGRVFTFKTSSGVVSVPKGKVTMVVIGGVAGMGEDLLPGTKAAKPSPTVIQGGAWTQKKSYSKVIPVVSDENMVVGRQPDAYVYWLDSDQTKGVIELRFHESGLFSRPASQVLLKLHIPDVGNAESINGLYVYCNNAKVGGLPKVNRNTWVEIPLDTSKIPPQSSITLVLRAQGSDGVAVSSKHSGMGAQLILVFP